MLTDELLTDYAGKFFGYPRHHGSFFLEATALEMPAADPGGDDPHKALLVERCKR